MRVIEPVLMVPLRRDFEAAKQRVQELLAEGRRITARTPLDRNPQAVFNAFLARLRAVRVLDPACGSGNFLYLALQALKDLEREAILWAPLTFQTAMEFPQVGPQAVLGIELNPYAAELARVVIWIGEIQWMLANGFSYLRDPILRPLDNIECRDAILDLDDRENPSEPEWPPADIIVGNPPFLGIRKMRDQLGDDYVDLLFRVWARRVSREMDYVCYWWEKARAMIETGKVSRAGLLATQGIRGGANRRVLEHIKQTGDIFMAWSDEEWIVEGAAVHVSIVGFDNGTETEKMLNGHRVTSINANLTAGLDLTQVRRLPENAGIAFQGANKVGPFDVLGDVAREMLAASNPDGRSNADVLRPTANGLDVNRRPRGRWIIDFGERSLDEAALYEAPFEYVRRVVYPIRSTNRRQRRREMWWLHGETVPGLRRALAGLPRFIATSTISKYRLFVWLPGETLPDHQLIAFARDDDYFFGVLHSHVHELWALGLGTQLRELESGFRYTPTTTFGTFPMPEPSPEAAEAVAAAARELDRLREGWLNPPGADAAVLQRRTLTNLYNERPTWLERAHARLDQAVHAAYGWPYPLDDEEILERLIDLNLRRSEEQSDVVQLQAPA